MVVVVVADESVMLLQFSILQCKHTDDKRCPGPDDDHHEFNSVHREHSTGLSPRCRLTQTVAANSRGDVVSHRLARHQRPAPL